MISELSENTIEWLERKAAENQNKNKTANPPNETEETDKTKKIKENKEAWQKVEKKEKEKLV